MQPDLPTPADVARRLSLKNVTIGEAREKVIQFYTDHWQASLTALAQKLIQEQGFSNEEALELCFSFHPMFEKSLTEAIAKFDQNAAEFVALCNGGENVG